MTKLQYFVYNYTIAKLPIPRVINLYSLLRADSNFFRVLFQTCFINYSCYYLSLFCKFFRFQHEISRMFVNFVYATRFVFLFQVSELIIHTDDTARQIYFLDTFLQHEVPLMFVGNTGTGKSAITNNYLVRLPKEK